MSPFIFTSSLFIFMPNTFNSRFFKSPFALLGFIKTFYNQHSSIHSLQKASTFVHLFAAQTSIHMSPLQGKIPDVNSSSFFSTHLYIMTPGEQTSGDSDGGAKVCGTTHSS